MSRWTIVGLLFLAAGCAGHSEPLRTDPGVTADLSGADWSKAETVDVKLTEFSFTPSELHFRQNQLYRLHLQDGGSSGHSFSAPKFFASASLRDDANSTKLRTGGGTIELKAGEEVDLYFEPKLAGTYPLECTHPLHATFGMTGNIVVQ